MFFYFTTDNSLHSAFKKDGGVEKILEHIQLGILRDGDTSTVSCHNNESALRQGYWYYTSDY